MKMILKLFCLSILFPAWAFACEPASLDWEQFHQRYDLNSNNTFELNEFLNVKDFQPLPWPDDKRFLGKDKNLQLFNFLDKDADKKLSDEELGAVHTLLPNPCEGWPWKE